MRGRVMGGYELRDHLGYDPNEMAFTNRRRRRKGSGDDEEDGDEEDGGGSWLRTGDKGYFDDQNRLFLSGRFKEVINRAGEKVSPLTVEHALLDVARSRLSGLVSLLVFATPHEELGETVGCAVTLETKSGGKSSSKSSGSSSSSAATCCEPYIKAAACNRSQARRHLASLATRDAAHTRCAPKRPNRQAYAYWIGREARFTDIKLREGQDDYRQASKCDGGCSCCCGGGDGASKRKQWQSGTTAASSSSCRRGYWPDPSHGPLLHRPHTPFNTQSQRQSSRS